MLTLAASQDALARRADVVPARLFKLTTYTDRGLGLVDREFYWSMGAPWWYEWGGGAAREFDDVVLEASPIEYAITHLPMPGRVDVRRTQMRLLLSPENVDGQSLWKTLSSDALLFARLEVATLLIEPARLVPNTAWWDLRDLPGTEHVVRFRGEFTSVEEVSDDGIALVFEGEEPNIDWPEALDAAAVDQKDLGRRYAIPFGYAKGIPCVNRNVGWATTLAQAVSKSFTGNVKVSSAAGLPTSGSFKLQIGGERVTATYVDADTVNITARARTGTVATAHQAGESIVEVPSGGITVVIAGVPIKALDALYVLHPSTRERVRVNTGYSTSLDNRTTDAGRRLALVTFTETQLESLLNTLSAAGGSIGWSTTLNQTMTNATTGNVTVVDASGFPTTGSFTLQIDAERVIASYVNSTTVNVSARAQGGTTAVSHAVSDSVLEINSGDAPDSARFGWGLQFYADVQGVTVPVAYGTGYGFDEGSSWSLAGEASQTDLSGAQKLASTIALIADTAGACDDSTLWTASSATLTNEGTIKTQGTNALKVAATSGGSLAQATRTLSATDDWSNCYLVFDVRPDNSGHITTNEGIRVKVSSGVSDSKRWSLGTDDGLVIGSFTTVIIDLLSASDSDSGTLNLAAVTELQFVANGRTNSASNVAYFDNVRILSKTAIMQRNTTSGTIDLTAALPTSLVEDAAAACDDHTLWTATAATLATETTIKTQGTGSVKITPTAAGTQAEAERIAFAPNQDWTGKKIAIDLYPTGTGHLGASDGVAVRFEDGGGDWRRWDFGTNDGLALDAWNTVVIDPSTGHDASSGTFTITDIDRVRVIGNKVSGSTSHILYFDNLRIFDSASAGLSYRVRMKCENVNRIEEVRLRISETAGSGTTLPASYRTMSLVGSQLREGEWAYYDFVATDTTYAVLSMDNVETVRVELVHNGDGLELPSVSIDSVGGALGTNADWDSATPGTLLQKGGDALRWLIGELGGVGAANVLGVSTVNTNLGSDVFAGNLCALGTDFGSVLARLCFETRINVVRREGASAVQYQLLSASSAYAFGASSRTLEELSALRERIRTAGEIATHSRWHYEVELADAQVATTEGAFRSMLRSEPGASDLTTPTRATLAAAAAVLGRRDFAPVYLLMSRDAATAKDVAGYYAAELVKYANRRWTAELPLWEAYDLEPGDIVAFTPRWASAAVKARVTGVTVDLAQPAIELACEEVA